MDSTDIVNVSLKKNYGPLELYISSHNLFNEIYQRPHGYSQDSRTIKFDIKTYY